MSNCKKYVGDKSPCNSAKAATRTAIARRVS